MTFTATFQIGYYPGSSRELFVEDAPVVVEFEADVLVERDPVEVDWPPVVQRGVSVDCDAGDVDIESVVLEVWCNSCHGQRGQIVDGDPTEPALLYRTVCIVCSESGTQPLNILSTLSPKDLTRLREECAEYAREHATDI